MHNSTGARVRNSVPRHGLGSIPFYIQLSRRQRQSLSLRSCDGAVLSSTHLSHLLHTMNPSYAADMSTQSSQFRPNTYQPNPTKIHQTPTLAPLNVAHLAPPPSQHQAPPSRPHSVAELAERAERTLSDDPRPISAWLRIAENARRDAKSFQEQGDLESAFVEFVRAAKTVLEKIPSHPDYRVLLSTRERHNLGLVSYFYLICPHNGGSVGHVLHECIFRVIHGCHLIQAPVLHPSLSTQSQPLIPLH